MCPGFRDHPPLPRRRSGSIRDRRIDVPGVDSKTRPLRILLVDDAPVNLAVCSRLLGRMGCQVDPATTGDYGLALFREGCPEARYDLVLDVYARKSVREWQPVLTPTGVYEMAGGSSFRILSGFAVGSWLSQSSEQQLGLLFGWPHTRDDMDEVNAMITAGQVRPVIGHRFPLDEAAAALRVVKDHGSLGKVMLDIEA